MADRLPPPPARSGTSDEEFAEKYRPHSIGSHLMLCVDVVNLGEKFNDFNKEKPKIQYRIALVFASGETNDGGLITVFREYALSSFERAPLVADMEIVKGMLFTPEDCERVSQHAEEMEGRACMVEVAHKVSQKGRTYGFIKNISAIPTGRMAPTADVLAELKESVKGYKRAPYWEDKRKEFAAGVERARREHPELRAADDEGIPF